MNNYVPINGRSSYSMGDSFCQIPSAYLKAHYPPEFARAFGIGNQ